MFRAYILSLFPLASSPGYSPPIDDLCTHKNNTAKVFNQYIYTCEGESVGKRLPSISTSLSSFPGEIFAAT